MKNILFLTMFLYSSFIFCSKNEISEKGSISSVLSKMKIKQKPDYLSEFEWEVLLYINFARLYPTDFCQSELIPYSEKVYSDKNSQNYTNFVKPAIDRLLGKKNEKNTTYVKNIEKNISLLGKVRVVEPSLAYTLGERDMLSDPNRKSHNGTNGVSWTFYANKYLLQNKEVTEVGYNSDVFNFGSGEIAWPILSESYTAKDAVIEWIIDRGNLKTGYGHREIILTFDNSSPKVGIAIHRNTVGNKNYPENSLALHVGFVKSRYEINNQSPSLTNEFDFATEIQGLNKNSKSSGLPFSNLLRTSAK